MISKSYRKNKSVFWIPIAIVLVLSAVLFSSKAFSSPETIMKITFNGDTWETNKTAFNKEWITTAPGNKITFEVDLSENVQEGTNTSDVPFEISIRNGSEIKEVAFNIDELPGAVGTGLYSVTIPVNDATPDGELKLTIKTIDGNSWGLPYYERDFSIKKDTTAPIVEITNLDGSEYVDDRVHSSGLGLKVNVTEKNLNLDDVEILISRNDNDYKKISPNVSYNGDVTSFHYSFIDEGDYNLTVTTVDKTGNKDAASSAHATFSIKKRIPTLSVFNKEADKATEVANNGFTNAQELELKVDSNISIKTVTLTANRDGKPYNLDDESFKFSILKRTATLTHQFPIGKYDIDVVVTDSRSNGETYKLPRLFFTVDHVAPTLSISSDETEITKPKNVIITAEDTNLDLSQTILTVKRNGETYEVENLELDSSGKKATNVYKFEDEGSYVVKLESIDKAGNKAESEEFSFTVDMDAPRFTVEGVEDKKYYSVDQQKVKIKVEDLHLDLAQTSAEVKKDGSSFTIPFTLIEGSTTVAEATHTFTENGEYTITLNSKDSLENTTETQLITFTIDNKPPEINVSFENAEEGQRDFNKIQKVIVSITDSNFDLNNSTYTVTKDNKDPETKNDFKVEGNKATKELTFAEDGVYKLKVNSIDLAKNTAEKVEVTFTIDQVGPKININGAENNKHYNKEEMEGKFKDGIKINASVEDYTLDESSLRLTVTRDGQTIIDVKGPEGWKNLYEWWWIKGKKQELTFQEDGEYKVTVYAADGHKANTSETLTFTIDRVAPVVTVSGDEDGIKNNAFVKRGEELTITVDEKHYENNKVKIEVTKDGKPYNVGTWKNNGKISKLKYTFNEDGTYHVSVSAVDYAGNVGNTETLSFTVDETPPVIKINVSKDFKEFNAKEQWVEIQVDEKNYLNSDVTINVTKNGKPFDVGTWDEHGTTSKLSHLFDEDGDYVIAVTAKDAAKNEAVPISKHFTIDKASPALKITGVEHMTNYNVNKQVSFEVNDANIDQTSIRVTKNGKAYNVGTPAQSRTKASLTHTFKEEGSYVLYFNATDKSGNKTTHDEIAFIIDKTNPVVKIDGVDHQSFNPTAKRVTVSVDELNFGTNYVVLSVTKDGKVFNIGTWQNNNKLSSLGYNFKDDGLYTVAISAEDKAGNGPIAANKTFTIDTTKPTIEITGVENAAHYNVDKPVSVTIRDVNLDVNRITVTRNGRGYNAGGFAVANQTARLSHNFSQEGDYVINVEAIDKAGNQFSNKIAFTIDKTAPVITPKFKGQSRVIKDGEYINEVFTPEFALDQADDTIVSVTMNGSNVTGRIPTASLEMTYKFSVLARDKAGNESTINISFILDTTKPTLNITGVIDGFFNKNQMPTVTYSDRYLDTSRTRVTLNGRPFVNGLQLSDEGDYILKAEIYDLANNVSSRTIVFTIDKTAPVIKFKEAISDKYFKESLLPELLIEDLNAYDIISQTLNGQPYNLGDPIEEEGKHVLFFEVKDKAGNIQQLSVEFIIDKTPPKVNFEGVKKNETYRDPVTLSISLDNPSDTLKSVMINGELFNGDVKEVNGTKVVTVTLSDINKYKVEVLAFDEAGNENNEAVEFEIVEKSVLVKFYENKTLFAGTMVGLVGAAAAGAVALRRSIIRRKDAKDM
ncbi:Ig-like domain-containing protein [Fredinandcohnia sp. QZ13]|uniref:Ig-like domain-containing protein n=1 Tax=Fredinandcohnia sp. QZ13 TaxID=3073144 RepID=UPI0028530C17|nr:Ig-like domain-containing protein [Fredinandcohnia sp. QZ13]MDR4889942.1 Ig-like domain-containing protein [Fredinandcohnia sp. QZ13]